MVRKMFTLALSAAALGLYGAAIASAQSCDDGCCGKGCTSVPDVKKVAVRCYDNLCEDLCLPSCTLKQFCNGLFKGWHCPDYCGGGHCNTGCESGSCDCTEGACKRMHCQQKYLLIKIRTHEETGRKCVPTGCPAGEACGVPVQMAPPPPGVRPEAIPAPKGAPGADEAAQQIRYFQPATNVAQ